MELKHIVGYLPYGLKGNYELSEVIPSAEYELRDKELRIDNIEFFLKYAKPILRPLSDLTKEIDVNGEKFVPILKICDFLKFHYIKYKLLDRHSIDLILDPLYHRANVKTKKPQEIRFWFSNFQGISFYCTNMNKLMYKDLYGAIQKLYEWHFDIHSLIEKGEAIDINTLKLTT